MAEGGEWLGNSLILLECLPHLACGIAAITAELASECIGADISTVIFVLR